MQRPALKAGSTTSDEFLAEEGRRTESSGEAQEVRAREGAGRSTTTRTEVADDGSRSRLSEREVFLSGRRAAEDAIQRQDVPAGYRRYLETYFKGIEPDPGGGR